MKLTVFLLVGFLSAGLVMVQPANVKPRVKRQIPVTPLIEFPSNTQFTEDRVPILDRPYSRQESTQYAGAQGLDHYNQFVNDPYVNTENLDSILQTRTTTYRPVRRRPEVRSGGSESYTDYWSRQGSSQQQQYVQQATTQSPYRYAGDCEPSTGQGQQDQRYDSQRRPYYKSGDAVWTGNEWMIESQGDNHITYRRRITRPSTRSGGSSSWTWECNYVTSPRLQQFDTQSGQVSAQVVDMRNDRRDEGRHSQQQQAGYDYNRQQQEDQQQRQYQRQRQQQARPETRALDTERDLYREQQQQRQHVRSGTSNVGTGGSTSMYGTSSSSYTSSSRTDGGSTYTGSNRNWATPYYGRRTTFDPNYPILHDRATAAKATVPNQVVLTL